MHNIQPSKTLLKVGEWSNPVPMPNLNVSGLLELCFFFLGITSDNFSFFKTIFHITTPVCYLLSQPDELDEIHTHD